LEAGPAVEGFLDAGSVEQTVIADFELVFAQDAAVFVGEYPEAVNDELGQGHHDEEAADHEDEFDNGKGNGLRGDFGWADDEHEREDAAEEDEAEHNFIV